MNVRPIRTHKITKKDRDILDVLDKYIKELKDGSVVVVASKIIAITEGRLIKANEKDKDKIIREESQLYIPKKYHDYGLYITIVNNRLTYSAGIDESNADGYLVLWPKDPQGTANKIREYLKNRFKLKKVGVIISDMTALPLRWGIITGEIAYSGFKPLNDLIGKPDIFGRELKYTKEGIVHGLAAAAGVVMGEGSEQTPIALISDIPFVKFEDKNPTKNELKSMIIKPEQDMYGPMFKYAPWKKGGKK